MSTKNFLLVVTLSFTTCLFGQRWVELMNDTTSNFYEVQEAFYDEWEGKEYKKGNGWKQFKRWEWYMEPRVYPTGNRINTQQVYNERKAFEAEYGTPSTKSNGWSPMGPNDWQAIGSGPGIGRINVVAEHPTNDQIIYAGSPSGGIWKTTDAGSTWEPLNDDFPTLGVSGIAIDHSDPQTIYIATGDKDASDTYSIGVVKSTDGGMTWNNTGLTHNLSQYISCQELIMHPFDPNTLVLATNQGLFKTIDGGVNWTQSASGDFHDVEYHPTNPSIMYASTDQMYRSNDGGDSFTQINNGLPVASNLNRIQLAVSEDEPDWVYALTGKFSDATFYGLYLSTDGGLSFQLQSDSPNIFGVNLTGSDGNGQCWYDMAIDADPNDATTILAGGVNIWKSTDAGQNWSINTHRSYQLSTNIEYTHADIHDIRFFNGNLYCGTDGGIYKTTDLGNNWNDLTPGMEISQFYRLGLAPQTPDIVIGGTQDNGSYLLKNNSWTHVYGADGMEAAVNPVNRDIMFCSYQFGAMVRSVDGGTHWERIFPVSNENGAWTTPYETIGSSSVIIGYENVWKSTNNGDSFNSISTFAGGDRIRHLDVCDNDEDIIYVSFYGSLHKTEDGGTSWQNVTSNLPNIQVSDIQIHPTHTEIVWVTSSGFNNGEKVFVTTNGGVSWENISGNLPNIPANTLVYQEGTDGGLYVGMDVGIYYTDSTLTNWQAFDTDLPNVIISELEIHYGGDVIRAATYGRGIWESELYTPSTLLPEANFITSLTEICPSDSITFKNASINASPGWTWYFPGGSPSTSSAARPTVTFPSSGVYDVSLVVDNANGSDSITKAIEVTHGQHLLDFSLQTDNYPDETSWEILDDNGDLVTFGRFYEAPNSLYERDICLSPGCYKFKIHDLFGNGICCFYGNGFFELTNNDDILIQGGDFESTDTYNFCVGGNTKLSSSVFSTFDMYPNPASDELNILPSLEDNYDITIMDVTGRVIKEVRNVQGDYKLDIAHFASGIYHITLKIEGRSLKRKFVKE